MINLRFTDINNAGAIKTYRVPLFKTTVQVNACACVRACAYVNEEDILPVQCLINFAPLTQERTDNGIRLLPDVFLYYSIKYK